MICACRWKSETINGTEEEIARKIIDRKMMSSPDPVYISENARIIRGDMSNAREGVQIFPVYCDTNEIIGAYDDVIAHRRFVSPGCCAMQYGRALRRYGYFMIRDHNGVYQPKDVVANVFRQIAASYEVPGIAASYRGSSIASPAFGFAEDDVNSLAYLIYAVSLFPSHTHATLYVPEEHLCAKLDVTEWRALFS